MSYEQKDMSGSLFRNDRKESDTHPDYKGSALLNGVDHWVDSWVNTSKDGKKYMSLKFKPKDAQGGGRVSAPAVAFDDDADSIPF